MSKPIFVMVEVEVFPEYVDAELMVGEKLRDLYMSQPGCQTVRLFKDFDNPTSFFLVSHWEDLESSEKASIAWSESDVLPEALGLLTTTPDRHIYTMYTEFGNTLGTMPLGTVAAVLFDTRSPGMGVDGLMSLTKLAEQLAVSPGFLGSVTLDDMAVEELMALIMYWMNYRTCREAVRPQERHHSRVLELMM